MNNCEREARDRWKTGSKIGEHKVSEIIYFFYIYTYLGHFGSKNIPKYLTKPTKALENCTVFTSVCTKINCSSKQLAVFLSVIALAPKLRFLIILVLY